MLIAQRISLQILKMKSVFRRVVDGEELAGKWKIGLTVTEACRCPELSFRLSDCYRSFVF